MVTRLLSLFVLAGWITVVHGAELIAVVDRTELLENEHVMLTLSLVNSDTRLRAEGLNPNIDLTVLNRDFEPGIPEADHRYTISRGAGRSSSNLRVVLFPRHTGTLTIPSFTVDNVSSRPISIIVHGAANSPTPEVFVRGGSDKTTLWNREQALVYLDFYRRIELKSAKLGSDLETEPLDVELTRLAESSRDETVNGIRYQVTRSSWLLAPQRTGKQQITFPEVWIETADNRRLHLPLSSILLTVKPLPENIPPLILVGKPRVEQAIDKSGVAAGRIITWDITLSAPTRVSNLPGTLPDLAFPEHMQVYRDPPVRSNADLDSGGLSSVRYRYFLAAGAAGQYRLPAVEIPYFDTGSGQLSLLTLDGPVLSVSAGTGSAQQQPDARPPAIVSRSPATTVWMIAAVVLAILWLVSLFLLWRKRNPAVKAKLPGREVKRHGVHRTTGDIKQQLLDAMACRTLEEGNHKWQHVIADDPLMQQTIRRLQQKYYARHRSPDGDDESGLSQDVAYCIKKISKRGHPTPAEPRWLAEHFLHPGRMTRH